MNCRASASLAALLLSDGRRPPTPRLRRAVERPPYKTLLRRLSLRRLINQELRHSSRAELITNNCQRQRRSQPRRRLGDRFDTSVELNVYNVAGRIKAAGPRGPGCAVTRRRRNVVAAVMSDSPEIVMVFPVVKLADRPVTDPKSLPKESAEDRRVSDEGPVLE